MFHTHIETPIGTAYIAKSNIGIYRFSLNNKQHFLSQIDTNSVENGAAFSTEISEIVDYFAGTRTQFTFPLEMRGTAFQQKVWQALLEIPMGITWSYGQLAKHIGEPQGAQAVGAANGQNPIWLIVPCHRVIGANGDLTGYAGGIETKRWLLQHEGAILL
jgi:methylated-DNA-[protein]-cysteine S-methyltransferase